MKPKHKLYHTKFTSNSKWYCHVQSITSVIQLKNMSKN